jgi:hypothetical protein
VLPLGDTAVSNGFLPFSFVWKSHTGKEYALTPYFLNSNIQFPTTGEELTRFFYYPSTQPINSTETAALFSQLSKSFNEREFKKLFSKEFSFIKDISIEITGGSPVLHAAVPGVRQKIPIPNVSGAINRILAMLLTMAARPGGALLVDEMENGIYYTHHLEVWSAIISFANRYDFQLFTSTHSREWLSALIAAAERAKTPLGEIRLWRVERINNRPIIWKFDGETLKAGLDFAGEPRGGQE